MRTDAYIRIQENGVSAQDTAGLGVCACVCVCVYDCVGVGVGRGDRGDASRWAIQPAAAPPCCAHPIRRCCAVPCTGCAGSLETARPASTWHKQLHNGMMGSGAELTVVDG